jgi:hypothetical protein
VTGGEVEVAKLASPE